MMGAGPDPTCYSHQPAQPQQQQQQQQRWQCGVPRQVGVLSLTVPFLLCIALEPAGCACSLVACVSPPLSGVLPEVDGTAAAITAAALCNTAIRPRADNSSSGSASGSNSRPRLAPR
jgi:hypothetical protein